MNKTKFFMVATILLLVLNVILLGSRFYRPGGHQKPRELVIKRLNFDESQIKEYDVLIQAHRKSVVDLESKIRAAKQNLYNQMSGDDGQNYDSLLNEINLNQSKLERIHLQHFLDIKSICKPEQMIDYQLFVKDINKVFGPKRPHKPKGR